MQVTVGTPADQAAWLILAAEVEPLFGPLVREPGFLRSLDNNLARGTAFCVRENDGPPGAPLLGGLLFSPKPPRYRIGWLAVAQRAHRQGIGNSLLHHALAQVIPPATITVITFGADNPAGEPARRFYEKFGFEAAEMVESGPDSGTRQRFRLAIPNTEPV